MFFLTAGACCCKCCAKTTWDSQTDECNSCNRAASDEVCLATTTATTTTSTTTTTTTTTTTPAPVIQLSHSNQYAAAATTTTEPRPESRSDFNDEELLTAQIAGMTTSELTDIGYSINEMVLDCQFAGSTCKPRSEVVSVL